MPNLHIVRYSFKQAFFDTPTVGHFLVSAKNARSAEHVTEGLFRRAHFDNLTIQHIAER